jgi:type IV secretion system protein VirD4
MMKEGSANYKDVSITRATFVASALVTAWQSVAQIEAAYGRQSQAILTNHLTKLFFAGMSDAAGLNYLSRLLGQEHVPSRLSSQAGSGGDRPSVTGVPLVPPAALRQMRPGDALLVHGTLPPAHVRIKPWYRSRRLRNVSDGRHRGRTSR